MISIDRINKRKIHKAGQVMYAMINSVRNRMDSRS